MLVKTFSPEFSEFFVDVVFMISHTLCLLDEISRKIDFEMLCAQSLYINDVED